MPMNTIPLSSYNQLNARPLRPQAAAWERRIPSQLIVDYANHQFLDILLAMRHSWDMVPIVLLHRELEYAPSTTGTPAALGHIAMPGPIVRALAKGLEKDSITPSSFQDSCKLGKALNLLIGMLGGKHWHHAEQPRRTDIHLRPSFYLQRRSLNVWRHGENSYQKAKPTDRSLDIMMQMMSTLKVMMNNRMMDIAAHRQEAAALFDIYEAVIYKEANNVDKAEMQQNTTKLDDEIQCILDNNKPAPKHMN
ncbi:hypothetical protein BDN71DRAFT_1510263 [Pleurotus eryngii]|uniref:Uncharacterized protein n=1 Tax=Pleurotus eryngii TaxID=5323 RepID=A0A9P6DCA4_PLEER|nr:hypothetical protein BDN71DRAFT_1510263 [Pleurotus eryngii]